MYLIFKSWYDDEVVQKNAIGKADLVEALRTSSVIVEIEGNKAKRFVPKENKWVEVKVQ